jgi:hypothetical protein
MSVLDCMATSLRFSTDRPGDDVRAQVAFSQTAAVAAILAIVTAILFLSAPHGGQFWWSDAPRHALNGAFVKDLIAQHPLADPVTWAMQYYVRYPGLTILFYPPLFYFTLAPFYAVFGVNHATAIGVVLLHHFALALGLYVLARRWVPPTMSALVGIAVLVTPGMAEWGRQVMLEIPTLAYAVWGMLLLRIYAATGRPRPLYWGALLLICALYTKLNTVFLLPVVALMLLAGRGPDLWRDRNVWIATVLACVALLPLLLLTLRFGSANLQSVAGVPDAVVARDSVAGWLWYGRRLTREVWWPLLLAACLWPFAVILRPDRGSRLDRADATLVIGWALVGYVFFSAISLKDARYTTQFIPPLVILAMLAMARLFPARAATAMATLLVAVTALHTTTAAPVPMVSGYREAAAWIAANAPADATMVFAGVRDGSFVFNMRTMPRRDITTLRADKLLMDIAVRRELGVVQHDLSEVQIGQQLDRLGVRYVVAQDDFWTDIPVMQRFQSVLHSPQFEAVAAIPVVANVPTVDRMLRIYRNRDPIAPGPHGVELRLPIIGETVKGTVGR